MIVTSTIGKYAHTSYTAQSLSICIDTVFVVASHIEKQTDTKVTTTLATVLQRVQIVATEVY